MKDVEPSNYIKKLAFLFVQVFGELSDFYQEHYNFISSMVQNTPPILRIYPILKSNKDNKEIQIEINEEIEVPKEKVLQFKNVEEIIEKSDTSFYSTIISRVDYNSVPEFIFQDAGLYMMASYPRIDLSEIEFGDDVKNSNGIVHMILEKEMSKTNDFLANKSVMGSLFAINDTTRMFLFSTHVQAIGTREHKQFQMKQIYSFINTTVTKVVESRFVNSSENLIVILAGDFNSNAYSPESFRAMLNILGNPRDLHMEFNVNKREFTWRFRSSSRPRRFDYILAYDSLSTNTFRKVAATYINTIDVKDDQNNSISDHKALKANIRLYK